MRYGVVVNDKWALDVVVPNKIATALSFTRSDSVNRARQMEMLCNVHPYAT
jgi:hypothetical protein